MQITKISIDGFGLFHKRTIDGFQPGVNLLFGKNEAGKTTLLDFIRFTLTDYPTYLKDRRPPINGGEHGGRIFLTNSAYQNIELYRNGDRKKVEFHLNNEKFTQDNRFKQLTNHVSSNLYENIYAITLDELSDVDQLDDSGMKDRIFSLGMGLSGADYGTLEKSLVDRLEYYYKARGRKQKLIEIVNNIKSKEKKINILQSKLHEYNQKSEEKERIEKQIETQAVELSQLKKESSRLTNYLKVYPIFIQYESICKELDAMGKIETYALQIKEDYKDSDKSIEIKQIENQRLINKVNQQKEELQKLNIDESLIPFHSLIDFIKRNSKTFEDALQTLEKQKHEIEKIKAENQQILQQLGSDFEEKTVLHLTGTKALRNTASQLVQIETDFKSDFKLKKSKFQDEELALKNLNAAYQKAQQQLESLPLKSEKEAEDCKHKKSKLEADYDRILSQPKGEVAGTKNLASIFSVVFLLAGIGLLFVHLIAGIIISILALSGILLSLTVFKNKKSAPLDQQENPRKIKLQLDEWSSQLAEFHQINNETESFKVEIEKLNRKLKQSENQIEKLKEERSSRLDVWKDTLQDKNLPVSISPINISDILLDIEKIQKNHQIIQHLNREIESANEKITDFKNKLEVPLQSGEVNSETVNQLLIQLENNLSQWSKKDQIEKHLKELQAEKQAVDETLEMLSKKLNSLEESVHVSDKQSFYQQFENQEIFNKLNQNKLDIENQIKTHCGENEFENTLNFLRNNNKEEIESNAVSVKDILTEKEKESDSLKTQKTTLITELNHILKPDDMYQLSSEKEGLIAALEAETQEWLTTQIAYNILRENKEKYEANHQPDVIKHTLKYFRKITKNAYQDIRISMSDNEVAVYDTQNNTKSVEELSRGTKEQLLLALRLGLIEEYEKNAEPLPVIFDDVMVNFDLGRTKRYAEIITEFAQTRQVLYFTCHEYVKEIFQEQGATIVNW